MSELERIEEEEKKPIEAEWFIRHITKHMILKTLTEYVFLGEILKIILLI